MILSPAIAHAKAPSSPRNAAERLRVTDPVEAMIELSRRANNILVQELGVVDAMRFLSQFRVGSGNYTAEREQIYQGASVKSIGRFRIKLKVVTR